MDNNTSLLNDVNPTVNILDGWLASLSLMTAVYNNKMAIEGLLHCR